MTGRCYARALWLNWRTDCHSQNHFPPNDMRRNRLSPLGSGLLIFLQPPFAMFLILIICTPLTVTLKAFVQLLRRCCTRLARRWGSACTATTVFVSLYFLQEESEDTILLELFRQLFSRAMINCLEISSRHTIQKQRSGLLIGEVCPSSRWVL